MFTPSRRFKQKVVLVGLNLAAQVAAGKLSGLCARPVGPAAVVPTEARAAAGRRPRAKPAPAATRLRELSAALGLARLQLRAGRGPDAQHTLDRLHVGVQRLCREFEDVRAGRAHAVPWGVGASSGGG